MLCIGVNLETQAGTVRNQGDIRGVVTAATSVPDSGSTALLLAAGICGVMLWKKKIKASEA
jgi:hypothetical protein